MTQAVGESTTLEEEAFRWLEELKDERQLTDERRRDFWRWLLVSPEHLRCMVEEIALEEVLAGARAARRNAARGHCVPQEEVDISALPPRSWASHMFRWGAGLALWVVVPVLAMWTWTWGSRASERNYAAETAPLSVTFDDGTFMNLHSGSIAKVRYSHELREVLLSKGQAHLEVHHDRARPFKVKAGDVATVTALGTVFDVWLSEPGTQSEAGVRVSEGHVQVVRSASAESPVDVLKGQEALITASGVHLFPAAGESPASAVISFQGKTLAQVVAAFNLRNHVPKLIVEGLACGRMMDAELDVDDPGTLLRLLALRKSLVLNPANDPAAKVVRIRQRGDSSPPGANPDKLCTPDVTSPPTPPA